MSSVKIQTSGCRSSTSQIGRSSSAEYAAPVGLHGLFSMNHLVRGVIACSSASARSLKPWFCSHGTSTGLPSASDTMSG